MKSFLFSSIVLLSIVGATAAPRVANTTIDLPDSPPVLSIEVENAFPGLSFSQPLCLSSPAGDTQRLFVCEKTGDIELIPNVTATAPTKTVFLDLDGILTEREEPLLTGSEMGLLSVAFHPDYASNGFFFIVYNVEVGGQNYQRLSRWHDPNINDTVADPNSEEVLIEMLDQSGNHNGGDLHFGPDGYLYMSWGDEGGQNDSHNNSQLIDNDFWSSLTRIDVDLEPEDYTASDGEGDDDANVRPNAHAAVKLYGGNPLYEVPAENPWVGATTFNGISVNPNEVRTEFFAVGFRNPWRFSFDSLNGELWVGDVGQGAWEEIVTVEIGSNHGWAWYEGDGNGAKFNQTINGADRRNVTVTAPVWDYGHGSGPFQGNSVSGGFVYRGSNIPDLFGKYIFADYTSGNIWSLDRTDTPGEPEVVRIAGEGGIVGFGSDPSNGDVLMADIGNGVIRRLVANDGTPGGFPATLSATGIFSDLTELSPNPGVVPYAVNLPFWSDHALKQRWFAIKDTTSLIGYSEDRAWQFPDGMVWVKHFDLELERGNSATKKRIETRVLVRNQSAVVGSEVLLASGVTARYFVPTNASIEDTWYGEIFDDSSWSTALTGIGYDENPDYGSEFGLGGDLGNDLNGENETLYVRIPFQVTDASALDVLTLKMKYDDGFVAYLNGERIASANAPDTLSYNAGAAGQNPDDNAVNFEDFDISRFLNFLTDGSNVLAIHGLNDGLGSSDMLILPEIHGGVTRFIPGVYGVSYRWNEAGTEATLAGAGGVEFDLDITVDGNVRSQTWSVPSRAACNTCHTPEAGFALSFNTRQLNHDGVLGAASGNFLTLLEDCRYLDELPDPPAELPKHVAADQTEYSLGARVRSYLDVNCAYCHQDPGIEPLSWRGNLDLNIAQTGLINGLASGGTQHPDDRLVVPGEPARSILLNRAAAANGYTRMPPLATNEIDEVNAQLLTDWINLEASELTDYAAWRLDQFGNGNSPEGEPSADPDGDGESNQREWITLTNPNDGADFLVALISHDGSHVEITLPGRSNRSVVVQRSVDLLNWSRWEVMGNDGIPRNPAIEHTITGATDGSQEFFRLYLDER